MKCLALVVALAPGLCSAAPEWFLAGGIGVAEREYSQEPFDQLTLEFEDGLVYHVEGGAHLESGLMLRGNYTHTHYDALTALDTLLVAENVRQRELRLGGFYAPRIAGRLGYRIGGGYATFGDAMSGTSQGAFAEAAAVLQAGALLSWDLSVAHQAVSGDTDLDGSDLRLAVSFRTEPCDLTFAARRMGFASDDDLVDYRLSVGRRWGALR